MVDSKDSISSHFNYNLLWDLFRHQDGKLGKFGKSSFYQSVYCSVNTLSNVNTETSGISEIFLHRHRSWLRIIGKGRSEGRWWRSDQKRRETSERFSNKVNLQGKHPNSPFPVPYVHVGWSWSLGYHNVWRRHFYPWYLISDMVDW